MDKKSEKKNKEERITDLSKLSEIKDSIIGRKAINVAREFNVSIKTINEFLKSRGGNNNISPMDKIGNTQYNLLSQEFGSGKTDMNSSKEGFFSRKKDSSLSKNKKKSKYKEKSKQHPAVKFLKAIKKQVDQNKKVANILTDTQKNINLLLQDTSKAIEIKRPAKPIVKNNDRILSVVIKELKISINTAIHFLKSKGYFIESAKARITNEEYLLLSNEYGISTNESEHYYYINIDNDQVFLTEEKRISISAMNLPTIISKFKKPVSWLIKVNYLRKKGNCLFADIISYHKGFNTPTHDQERDKNFLSTVKTINFKDIDKESLLLSYTGNQTSDIMYPYNKAPTETNKIRFEKLQRKDPAPTSLNEKFTVDFSDIEFKSGKVVFKKKLWLTGKVEELEIPNRHILKEFEPIKNYFQKALGIHEINVEIKVKNQASLLSKSDLIISSIEIDKINENLIGLVKIGLVKRIARAKQTGKSSFTIDKVFESTLDDEINASIFYTKESQFLDDILTIKNTKHSIHLKYLASKQSNAQKLHFFVKPFSFIFLLDGEEKRYIVWETLDTFEATYIWEIEKDITALSDNFRKIELTIFSIKDGGKHNYIENSKDPFKRIYHNYSEAQNGFSSWKLELDALIK